MTQKLRQIETETETENEFESFLCTWECWVWNTWKLISMCTHMGSRKLNMFRQRVARLPFRCGKWDLCLSACLITYNWVQFHLQVKFQPSFYPSDVSLQSVKCSSPEFKKLGVPRDLRSERTRDGIASGGIPPPLRFPSPPAQLTQTHLA